MVAVYNKKNGSKVILLVKDIIAIPGYIDKQKVYEHIHTFTAEEVNVSFSPGIELLKGELLYIED